MKRAAKNTLVQRMAQWAREALLQNLGLKALCLTLALGLTAYQRGSQDEQQRTISVGVVVRLPTSEIRRELMTLVPPSVHVTVRGSTSDIDQLAQSSVSPVELDLRKGLATQVVFEPQMFAMPPGVDVVVIDPASIELEWQDIIQRPVPIQTSMTGSVADGYEVTSAMVEPRRIMVEGPARLVNVLQFVRLAAFDISGKKDGTHQHMLALDPAPPRTQYLGPATAKVAVTIERKLSTRRFTRQRVVVIGPVRARSKPEFVDVAITGLPEVLEGLRPEMIVPRLDVEDLVTNGPRHGSAVRTVKVDLTGVETIIQPPTASATW